MTEQGPVGQTEAQEGNAQADRELNLPEANIFTEEFMPSFELTLDQQE